ncbi:MAG TPA: ABC transporter ATP-binding protein [Mycobacteriales bacterium]|jgi:putative ABC transport system ATP-binding protein|nr:ABC transporter ATP-binding protein [Mycobacteriales bacterium]
MSADRAASGVSPLYVLEGVGRAYAKDGITVEAVRSVDLAIEPGEMVALEGPSGSGKSTLLQLLGALDVPTRGSIRFDGRELARQSDAELTQLRSREIGFVFQHFNLIPTLTAAENVELPMVPAGTPRPQRQIRARELLAQVGLSDRADHLPSRLSGGEQQRVAIARALANHPRVVIADEPTGNLDSTTAKEVMALLSGLRSTAGVTIVLATHDEDVARSAQRRIQLRDGLIVAATRRRPPVKKAAPVPEAKPAARKRAATAALREPGTRTRRTTS